MFFSFRSLKRTVAASWITVINRTTTSPNRNLNNIFSFSFEFAFDFETDKISPEKWVTSYFLCTQCIAYSKDFIQVFFIKTAKFWKNVCVWQLLTASLENWSRQTCLSLAVLANNRSVCLYSSQKLQYIFGNKNLDFLFLSLILILSNKTKTGFIWSSNLCLYIHA